MPPSDRTRAARLPGTLPSGAPSLSRRARIAIVVATTFGVAAAFMLAPTITAAEADDRAASTRVPSALEFDGADCQVPVQVPPGSNQLLPDPFTSANGSRVATVEDWRCRRAEIKRLAELSVYGAKPARPATVSGTVTASRITVNVSDQGRSTSFAASVSVPSGQGPFPAVIVYGGFGADTAAILNAGAAVISYDPGAVGAEGTPRGNKQGAFYDLYGASSGTGILMAQAWGVSRIIDVVEQSGGDILRADMGVTGCSRYGKGAFVAGAFDQRIALTMPIESGTGGVPVFRGVAGEQGAQLPSSAYGEQPWLGDAFNAYTGDPSGLPIDTHQIVGMIAPRGLFIMENPHVDWLGSASGSVGALGGREIYRALGAEDHISYHSNTANGTHCATRSEWSGVIGQSIRAFLRDAGSAPGVFDIAPSKSGDLARWRDWQTPTLSGGGPGQTTPPTTTAPPVPSTPPGQTTSPPPSGPGCGAEIRVVHDWGGGWQGDLHVTATGSAVSGWRVSWTWPSGQTVRSHWNADLTSSGSTVTASDVGWNGRVAAGQTVNAFGFIGTGTAASPAVTCTAA